MARFATLTERLKALYRRMGAVLLLFGLLSGLPAYAADNTIYATDNATPALIYTLNASTGAVTSVSTLSFATNAIGRDPNSGRIFYLESASPYRVAYFDPATSSNTILPGQLGFSTNRAAFDASGVFWVMDPSNNNLYTVNLTTGVPTFFGTVTGIPTALGGDIAFSPSGQLYVVANTVLYGVTGLSAVAVNTSLSAAAPGLAFVDGPDPIVAIGTNLYRASLTSNTTTLVGPTVITITDLGAYPKYANLQLTKTAGSAIFARNTNATYTLAVQNNGPHNASGPFTIVDTLPAGLTYVSTSGSGWTCSAAGQTVTCTDNQASLGNGASLSPLTLTVAVGAAAPNSVTNTATVSSATFDQDTTNNTSAITTSVGAPTITKSFNPTIIPTSGISTLTLTLANNTATALTGVSFNDPFPANLVVASTPGLSNTCGGTITGGAAGNNSIGLNNGALAANGSCTISVNVTSSVVGTYSNTTTGVSSTQTGAAGAPSNTAVLNTARPTVAKSFSPARIGPGTNSTLTITLSNAANVALTGVAFTDTYPTTPGTGIKNTATPSAATTCGGTVTAAALGGSVALSGATIPANGSCTVTVQVTAAAAGDYVNTVAAGAVSTTNGGSNLASATDILAVSLPGISKLFTPSAISTNSPSTLTITLSNSSATTYTGAAFTDTYTAGINNTATPSTTNTCGGTVTAAAGGGSVALVGGTIPANGSCQITVQVTSATAGSRTNTVAAGALTTINGGSNASATSALLVASVAPDLRLTKTHSGNLTVGTNAGFQITVNNTLGSAATSGTITVTDVLPTGLTFVSGTGTGWTCGTSGQTVTCTSTTVVSAGATSPNPITLTVAVGPTAYPSVSNTATVSGGGETNNTNDSATDTATVLAPNLRLTKAHSGNFTVGSTGAYTLTVDNGLGSGPTSGSITVIDTLPTGLTFVASGSGGAGWACSAAAQVVTCTSSTVIAAGATGSPITINAAVAATAVPTVTNSATVSGGSEPPVLTGNNDAFDPTVTVQAPQNTFAPDGAQTALPGTTIFYTHRFNAGLTGTVAFSTTNVSTPAVAGWNNVTYRDTNCNGVLDGVEGSAPLAGSISVNPGDVVCLIVKEFVPAGAPYDANDVITITAAFTPASGPVVNYTRTDITTVGNAGGAGLGLAKTVRNVTTGGAAGTSNAAKPGETLEYTITYSNNSADPLATIVINDATPAFTTFVAAACGAPLPANLTACSVTTQPAAGATGAIVWTLTGSLVPTQSGTVIFRALLQ